MLGEVVEEEEGQEMQRCCLEEEEGTQETVSADPPQVATSVWS